MDPGGLTNSSAMLFIALLSTLQLTAVAYYNLYDLDIK